MESISSFNEAWEEIEARLFLIYWALSKEESGNIFITSLVWPGQGSNPWPPTLGANALPLSRRCGQMQGNVLHQVLHVGVATDTWTIQFSYWPSWLLCFMTLYVNNPICLIWWVVNKSNCSPFCPLMCLTLRPLYSVEQGRWVTLVHSTDSKPCALLMCPLLQNSKQIISLSDGRLLTSVTLARQ